MEYSLGDLVDRLIILELKIQRIKPEPFLTEFEAICDAVANFKSPTQKDWILAEAIAIGLDQLREANSQIWDLESDIRMGKEGQLGLEEVGRRAILIRDINEKRVKAKNELNRVAGSGFQEFKSTFRV